MAGADRRPAAERAKMIAAIHCGRRQLAIDDEAWKEYLRQSFSLESTARLSFEQLRAALNHLIRCGLVKRDAAGAPIVNEWAFIDTAVSDRQPLLRKLLMQARAAGIETGMQVAYIEGIAKQMGGAGKSGNVHTPLRFCDAWQLRLIVAAMEFHLKRRHRGAPADA